MTNSHHRLRKWVGAGRAPSHFLEPMVTKNCDAKWRSIYMDFRDPKQIAVLKVAYIDKTDKYLAFISYQVCQEARYHAVSDQRDYFFKSIFEMPYFS